MTGEPSVVSAAARWSLDQIEALHRILREVQAGSEGPFGRTDSRTDLRDFPLNLAAQRTSRGGRLLKGLRLENVDLSGADLSGVRLEDSTFENCLLDRAVLENLTDLANRFFGCSFSSTSWRNAGIGYGGSTFAECSFYRAEFKGAVFIRGEFDDTVFNECRLDGIDFGASSFCRCVFTGTLRDVWFRGRFPNRAKTRRFGKPRPNKMEQVDFSSANLRDIIFSDCCGMGSVVLPDDGRHHLLDRWSERLLVARHALLAESESAERADALAYLESYRVHAEHQSSYIINRDDLPGADVESREWLLDLLRQLPANSDCA